jgi:predicted DNA-binding transcriptional regulator AlpA
MSTPALSPLAPPPEECLWTVNDVCRYLQASRSWVYQQAAAGVVPSLRITGFLRFEPAKVRAWALGQQATADVLPLKRP